jgi:hypothetical protein
MGINLLIIKRSDGTHMPESIHLELNFHSIFAPPPLKLVPRHVRFRLLECLLKANVQIIRMQWV